MKTVLLNLVKAIWISSLISPLLMGCGSTISGKMPTSSLSMAQTYNEAITGESKENGNNATLSTVGDQVKNFGFSSPLYRSTQRTKNAKTFHRLPNPDVALYVYPHWVKDRTNKILVPGYFTVFPFYTQAYYGM